jgi:FixJ family two-component response regulator
MRAGAIDVLTKPVDESPLLASVSCALLNKQIAGEPGTAVTTVKVHRGRVMEKLAVGSVAQLAR